MTRYLDLVRTHKTHKASQSPATTDLVRLNAFSASPEQHPTVLRALDLLEGRVVDRRPISSHPPRPRRRVRQAIARGTKLRLEEVELPALKLRSPTDNDHEHGRHLRDNCARRVWQLTRPDDSSAGEGLFVDRQVAIAHAQRRGWEVTHRSVHPSFTGDLT